MRVPFCFFAIFCCYELGLAQPAGFEVVQGMALAPVMDASGALIIQSQDRSIIHWDSFSIGSGEILRFQQTGANAAVLNRVLGGEGSNILGTLQSNGLVYLINPNGVLIGPGGRVETAGFIASSLDLLDESFLKERTPLFSGSGQGAIVNLGTISSKTGDVALIGRLVKNGGTIDAPQGRVGLAVGSEVLLQPLDHPFVIIRTTVESVEGEVPLNDAALANEGMIQALTVELKSGSSVYTKAICHSGTIDALCMETRGGEVYLVADNGACHVTGVVRAGGDVGGTVHVLGEEIVLLGAEIDTSAMGGGGTILIGGDYQGGNPDIKNARSVYVDENTKLAATAIDKGTGGKVIVWSDVATHFAGMIDFRGGEYGGDGGFAEVSGHYLEYTGRVDSSAKMGLTGTLLLDPVDLTLSAASTSTGIAFIAPNYSYTGTMNFPNIQISDIVTALGSSNVIINTFVTTENVSSQGGSINVNDPINWNSANSLTLIADSFIQIGVNGSPAGITSSGSGSLVLTALGDNDQYAMTYDGVYINDTISMASGNLTISGNGSSLFGGNGVTIEESISVASGNLIISGNGGAGGGYGVFVAASVSAPLGNLAITGTGGALGGGVGISINSPVSVTSGNLAITGTGGGGTIGGIGVLTADHVTSTSGNIIISGIGSGGSSVPGTNIGVQVEDVISSTTGNININGQGSVIGGAAGVFLNAGASVMQTTSGTITFQNCFGSSAGIGVQSAGVNVGSPITSTSGNIVFLDCEAGGGGQGGVEVAANITAGDGGSILFQSCRGGTNDSASSGQVGVAIGLSATVQVGNQVSGRGGIILFQDCLGGNLNVNNDISSQTNYGIVTAGTIIAGTSGLISMTGFGGGTLGLGGLNYGLNLGGSIQVGDGGVISLFGTGGLGGASNAGSSNVGVVTDANLILGGTGGNNITINITGVGGQSTGTFSGPSFPGFNHGIRITGLSVALSSSTGNSLNFINSQGGVGGTDNYGVSVEAGFTVPTGTALNFININGGYGYSTGSGPSMPGSGANNFGLQFKLQGQALIAPTIYASGIVGGAGSVNDIGIIVHPNGTPIYGLGDSTTTSISLQGSSAGSGVGGSEIGVSIMAPLTVKDGGTISLVGVGGGLSSNTGASCHGIYVAQAGTCVGGAASTVTYQGTGGGTNPLITSLVDNYGVFFDNGSVTPISVGSSAAVTFVDCVGGNGRGGAVGFFNSDHPFSLSSGTLSFHNISGGTGELNDGIDIFHGVTVSAPVITMQGIAGGPGAGTAGLYIGGGTLGGASTTSIYISATSIGNGVTATNPPSSPIGIALDDGASSGQSYTTAQDGIIQVAAGGTLTIIGTGGGSGLDSGCNGIDLAGPGTTTPSPGPSGPNGSQIILGAGATGTITGFGGIGSGGGNVGFHNAGLVTVLGTLTVSGTGGTGATGQNHGILIDTSGNFVIGDANQLLFTGIGGVSPGAGANAYSYGVFVFQNTVAPISTSSGSGVTITFIDCVGGNGVGGGIGFANPAPFSFTLDSGTIQFQNIVGGLGDFNDGIDIFPGAVVSAPTIALQDILGGPGSGTVGLYIGGGTLGGNSTLSLVISAGTIGQGGSTFGLSMDDGAAAIIVPSIGSNGIIQIGDGGALAIHASGGSGTGIQTSCNGIDMAGPGPTPSPNGSQIIMGQAIGGCVATITGVAGSSPGGSNIGFHCNGQVLAQGSTANTINFTNCAGGNGTAGSNAGIFIDTSGSIHLNAGTALSLSGIGGQLAGGGGANNYGIHFTGSLTALGNTISLTGAGGNGTGGSNDGVFWNVGSSTFTGAQTLQFMNCRGGNGGSNNSGVHFNQGLSIPSGTLSLTNVAGGGTAGTSNNFGVFIPTGITVTAPQITATGILGGPGTNNNDGLYVNGGIFSATGNLLVSAGSMGNGTGEKGILVDSGGIIETSGSGTLSLTGVGSAQGTGTDYGIHVTGSGSSLLSNGTGTIFLTGVGGGSTAAGVQLDATGGVVVSATAGANINITSTPTLALADPGGATSVIGSVGGIITFDTAIDGTSSVALKISAGTGSVVFNQAVGMNTVPASLTVTGTGASGITINSNMNTNGAAGMSFSGPAFFGHSVTLNASGNGAAPISFSSTLNSLTATPQSIALYGGASSGALTVGSIGSINPLFNVIFGASAISVNGAITTSSSIGNGGYVLMHAQGSGGITINGPINTSSTAANSSAGNVTLNAMGGSVIVNSILANAPSGMGGMISLQPASTYTANLPTGLLNLTGGTLSATGAINGSISLSPVGRTQPSGGVATIVNQAGTGLSIAAGTFVMGSFEAMTVIGGDVSITVSNYAVLSDIVVAGPTLPSFTFNLTNAGFNPAAFVLTRPAISLVKSTGGTYFSDTTHILAAGGNNLIPYVPGVTPGPDDFIPTIITSTAPGTMPVNVAASVPSLSTVSGVTYSGAGPIPAGTILNFDEVGSGPTPTPIICVCPTPSAGKITLTRAEILSAAALNTMNSLSSILNESFPLLLPDCKSLGLRGDFERCTIAGESSSKEP